MEGQWRGATGTVVADVNAPKGIVCLGICVGFVVVVGSRCTYMVCGLELRRKEASLSPPDDVHHRPPTLTSRLKNPDRP